MTDTILQYAIISTKLCSTHASPLGALHAESAVGNQFQTGASHRERQRMGTDAGTHVRSAATLGGNLVLARNKYLESDVTTILMAAGVLVQVASQNADDR